MRQTGLTHVVVYGDREHYANITYLTGFDPRFEEALFIVGPEDRPLLVVGNECEGYVSVSALAECDLLRCERFQPFSLLSQPRDGSRRIRDIFGDEGIGSGARVGCVGWKYFEDREYPDAQHAIEIPAYLVDCLRELSGRTAVVNASALLMNPCDGLRTSCSVYEIAYFEYTNTVASQGVKRILSGLREGMSDHEAMALAGYSGLPLGCHITMCVGRDGASLGSPCGARIERGKPMAFNICYWGSNICRAGWIAEGAEDLPPGTTDYVSRFAGPYVEALDTWLRMMTVGRPGGAIAAMIAETLPFETFGVFLNPGHLIHLDEWVSSPIYPGSEIKLRSGMLMQIDVIPSSPQYGSTRMEEGVLIADAVLQDELKAQYPDCYARCLARREFMRDVIGFDVPDDLLPMSDSAGLVPPFFLAPGKVLALA